MAKPKAHVDRHLPAQRLAEPDEWSVLVDYGPPNGKKRTDCLSEGEARRLAAFIESLPAGRVPSIESRTPAGPWVKR